MKKNVLTLLVLTLLVSNINATDPSYSMEEELVALKKELLAAEDKLLVGEEGLVAVKKELSVAEEELLLANIHISSLEYKVEQLQNETLAISYEQLTRSKFFASMVTQEFLDFIYDNPVDKVLKTFEPFEVYATWEIVQVIQYRCEVWNAEIQNSILTLKKFLTKDDYEELLEGQKAWEIYIESSFYIEASLLYHGTKYESHGSMYIPRVVSIKSEKIRARAIELLSLIYIFTNEVSFVFTEN